MTAPFHPWDDSDLADAPAIRCATCGHGPSVHTGGSGMCWQRSCSCSEYVDADDVTAAMKRHPAGKALPARFDERYDPSPEPIVRRIQ